VLALPSVAVLVLSRLMTVVSSLLLAITLPVASAYGVGSLLRAGAAPRASQLQLSEPLIRIGHGYDIHRMAPREEAGQPVVIGGVKFDGSDAPDFDLGCVANSDGDVIYHSVVDAILGAITEPDIGQLFPDGKGSEWAGADSEIFMVEAYDRMAKRGYCIGNVDITMICEKPRLNVDSPRGGKVKQMMIDNVARLLKTDVSRVNVKARTHEKVDSVGECRALECHVVLIMERTSN
jgi:2-C-methyl-D-erythritol 2,4-cyclodiphosphate synthase